MRWQCKATNKFLENLYSYQFEYSPVFHLYDVSIYPITGSSYQPFLENIDTQPTKGSPTKPPQ
jgi:hypothetical protein